ncbi:TolB family protein [Singulisphaera sp. PoT]|uniref:TolB family protein n=1 Tax=Singulisphaera sp. PoT TaxID=3411797 RepID=UPI003BF50EA5
MLIPMMMTALLTAQHPAASNPEEVAAKEATHLKDIRQVTFGFARAGEGYFRPDGKAIIFQAVQNPPPTIFLAPAPNQDDYQIFSSELSKDAKPLMVSTGKGQCTCAYYHPDGKSILFASTHLDPAKPDGPRTPAYSRTERYKWEFPESMDIFRANPDGSNLVRLTDTKGYDAEGSYSADGKKIVFTSFRDGDGEIYVMDADGKNPKRITKAKGYDGGPFFSPDGKRIIYRSDRKDNDLLQIYINNTEGTEERALTNNEFVNWGPSFHPDSKHIIYATSKHGHQNYELYLMNVDTGTEERITFREGFDGLPVFSPDGTKLMWTSSGRTADKKSQLFIADFTMEESLATKP